MKQIKNWKLATVSDIEADGLLEEATIFHVLSFHMANDKSGSIDGSDHNRLKKFFKYHIDNEIPVVFHRGILFDIPLAEKLLDIDLSELMVIDTLGLSWYLNTKRKVHGLDSFLEDYGIPKPKVGEAEWVKPIQGINISMRVEGKGKDKKKTLTYKMIVDPEDPSEEYIEKGLDLEKVYLSDYKHLESDEDYRERVETHKKLMVKRCEEDVKINLELWRDFMKRLYEMYTITKQCIDSGQVNPKRMSPNEVVYLDRYVNNSTVDEYIERCLTFLMFKMDCARLQEKTRWKVDVDYLNETESLLSGLHNEAKEKLELIMNPVPKYGLRKKPSGDPYKKDGTPKVKTLQWNETLDKIGLKDHYGNEMVLLTDNPDEVKLLTKYEEPNANSTDQLKKLFYSFGWVPENFKYIKDEEAMAAWVKGGFRKEDKPEPRKVPQISIDGDEGKELCPSILKLAEDNPEILAYDSYTTIKHRLDTIKGFKRDMSEDGHLKATIGGFTNTLRVKHREIVNLCGVDKPYGENVRGSLTCSEDEILLGSDLSSLEDRTKHHFMLPHDPDYVSTMMADDYDPHILTAHSAGLVSDKELEDFKNGIKPDHVSKARKGGKSTNYACIPVKGSEVLTLEGYKDYHELVEGEISRGNINSEWVDTKIQRIDTLINQDIYKVQFKDGTSLYCTKEHSWVTELSGKGNIFKHSDELVEGDIIIVSEKKSLIFDSVKFSHKGDVFCVSTDTNTFTMRQNGFEVLTGNCVYGGSPQAISLSAGVDLNTAKKLHEGYWKLNWSVKAIAEEQCVIEDSRKQKWLINPINGICYSLRTEKDRFSTLAQGSGSFFFDMWVDRILYKMQETFKTKKLTGSFHKILWLQ